LPIDICHEHVDFLHYTEYVQVSHASGSVVAVKKSRRPTSVELLVPITSIGMMAVFLLPALEREWMELAQRAKIARCQ